LWCTLLNNITRRLCPAMAARGAATLAAAAASGRRNVEVSIPRFDPSKVDPGSVWLYLGKRKSGKSYGLEYHMFFWQWVTDAVVFSTTETANGAWSKHFPHTFVHDNFYPDRLERLHQRNGLYYKQREKDPSLPQINTLVLCEDCMAGTGKARLTNDKTIKDIVLNGRHRGFTLVIISQYVHAVTPDIRSNVDYVVLLENDMGDDLKKIYQHWFTKLGKFDVFMALFTQLTKDHGMMVLDRTVNDHGDFMRKIFRSRAPPPDKMMPYQLCHPLVWQFHDKRRRRGDDDDDDDDGDDIEFGLPEWYKSARNTAASGGGGGGGGGGSKRPRRV